nr:uncharacterized protein LOC128669553 [Plodia interpunctella]
MNSIIFNLHGHVSNGRASYQSRYIRAFVAGRVDCRAQYGGDHFRPELRYRYTLHSHASNGRATYQTRCIRAFVAGRVDCRAQYGGDHFRPELRYRYTSIVDVATKAARLKWDWTGYVCRMHPERWTYRLTSWIPTDGYRIRGRPRTRWSDDIKKFDKEWQEKTKDRNAWRKLGEAFVLQWDLNS